MKVIAKSANSQCVWSESASIHGREARMENITQLNATKTAIPNFTDTGM
jgi:hypothetical protein